MLDIIRRYRNGQAAHKKSVLLNKAAQKQTPSVVTPKDFGAKGDGVTDDTKAIQAWAEQKENRVLAKGIYLVSKPIVFTAGGGVIGEGGELLVADNFKGYSLFVCKATENAQQLFARLTVDMNNADTFIASEKESDWFTMNTCFFKNAIKGLDVQELQIRPLIK